MGASSEEGNISCKRNAGISSNRANRHGTTGAGERANDHKQSTKGKEIKANVGKIGPIYVGRGSTKASFERRAGSTCTWSSPFAPSALNRAVGKIVRQPINLLNHLDTDDRPRHRKMHNLNHGNSNTFGLNNKGSKH